MIFAVMLANVAAFLTMFSAIRWFVLVVTIPKHVLFPIILMMCVIGAYTINYGIMLDVWTLLIFWLFAGSRVTMATAGRLAGVSQVTVPRTLSALP